MKPKQELDRHQFGGTLGGPLVKGRTFFFLSYEGIREKQGAARQPDRRLRGHEAGRLQRRPQPDLRPAHRPAVPRKRHPGEPALAPGAVLRPASSPIPTRAPAPSPGPRTASCDADQVTLRIDHTLTEKHKMFVRYSFHDNRMDDPSSTLGAPYLAYPGLGSAHLHTRGQNIVAAVTSTFSPTVLNEFRFSYLPQVVDLEPFGLGTNYLQEAGIQGFEETGRPGVVGSFPDFTWSGYSNMSGSAFDQRPKTQDLKVFEWTDNVTHIRGRHILKGGDEDPPLAAALHRQQAVPGRLDLQRVRDPEPGEPRGHRRRLRRLHARHAAAGHAVVPGRHLRRPGHLLALLRPGRHPGEQPPQPQPRAALRVFAVGLGLPRPARHLRPQLVAADHRGQRERPDRPGLAVRGPLGLCALPAVHPDEQPGRPAPVHHQHRQGAVRAPLRLRLAASRTGRCCAAATASSSSRRTPTAA